jgi:predicted hydrocarbon binding protein
LGLFAEITREVVDRRGAEGADILFAAGLSFGESVVDALRMDGVAANALFGAAVERASSWGLGALSTSSAGEIPSEVDVSAPAAAAWAVSADGGPQCHILRGILAGFAQRVARRPVDVVETTCAGAGGTACKFKLKLDVAPAEDSWSW